jgi:hypothetical protein
MISAWRILPPLFVSCWVSLMAFGAGPQQYLLRGS